MNKKFIIIIGLPRSGSTLLLRLLNRVCDANIYGENFGAFKELYQFHHNMTRTLEWANRGYKIPLTRTEYEKTNDHSCAWYNEFDNANIREQIRKMIINIFDKDGKYKFIGFKEIRYGLISPNDVRTDEFIPDTFENMECQIKFLIEIFGDGLKILFLKRDPNQITKMKWPCFKTVNIINKIRMVESHFIKFNGKYKQHSILLDYNSLIDEKEKNIKKIAEFIGFDYKKNIITILEEYRKITK